MYFKIELLFVLLYFVLVLKSSSANSENGNTYDYIVVGGGTAGCIVAARLASFADVMMIEAGGEPPEVSVGSDYTKMWGSEYDWKFNSTVQENMNNRTTTLRGGKMLGGSGSINGMMFVRGNEKDYETWPEGWKWEEILPYFKLIEESHLSYPDTSGLHGTSGVIPIADKVADIPLSQKFLEAVKSLGYIERDTNDGQQIGVGYMAMNYFQNERQSTYTNYLNRNFGNPTIVRNAFVEKIIFETNDDEIKATGVVYKIGEQQITIKAKREVILTAGTIGTPKLLMLSGVGPSGHLQEMKINVVKDLQGVGSNFHDHFGWFNPFWVREGKDPYTLVVAYLNTIESEKEDNYPDIQLTQTFLANFGFVAISLLQPKSRGSVKLASNDPNDNPIIDPNYLSDDEDSQKFAAGLKLMADIVKKVELTDTGYTAIPLNVKECEEEEDKSDEYWRCVARNKGHTYQHFVGTCKMGDDEDTNAVVNSKLEVKGIKQLRIADASVMPSVVSANTQATVMMIAEKAAVFVYDKAVSDGFFTPPHFQE